MHFTNTFLFLILCCCFTFRAFSSHPNIFDDHISIDCGSSSTDLTASHPNFTLKGSSSTVSTLSLQPPPYSTARISVSQFSYSFQLNPGQKFIRLLFNPTSYNHFKRFHDFFTVEAGPFTLLSNFSASVTADALAVATFAKEFCLSVHENQPFNIVFSPATQHNYAFINGIEIISVPSSLDYCHGGDIGVRVVGDKSVIYIDNTTALELVSRKNIKRDSIPLGDDIHAVFGMWAGLRKQKSINQAGNVMWKVSVDVGFRYLIRLHFCEIGLKMAETARKDFVILINHTVATTSAEVLQKGEDEGTLWYKNYMVMVNGNKREGKRDIFISLHSKDEILYRHCPLEGYEIFKLSNHDNSLASPTPPPTARDSPRHAIQVVLSVLGLRNAIATVIIAIISLVNIILHLLLKLLGDDFHEEENKPSTRAQRLCRRFSLSEMQLATDNFDDAFVIGRGGFGKVYKGCIDKGKETVAIKRLKPNSKQGTREFWTEIETLSELRHFNLVSLIGYCNEDPEMILVYEYMPCGSLADHFYELSLKYKDRSSLSWKERLEICIGAGRGIDYLHTGHRFIHRDIKASNILLDENFVAKVSDFGLAKMESGTELQSQGSTNLKGTFGYIDPNYFRTRRITTKSDIYSFGVVLLEVLCGRPAVEQWVDEDKRSLTMWALDNINKGEADQIVAPSLRGEILPDSLMTFVRIAKRCLHDEPKKRPAMVHVLINLELALEQQANETSVADFFPFAGRVLQKNANSLVPNEVMDGADILPQRANVNPMVPSEITDFDDAFPCSDRTVVSVSTRQPTMTSSSMLNRQPTMTSSSMLNRTSPLTERINNKMNNAGTREGTKNIISKLSRRVWSWDALWKTAKSSKKKEPGDIFMSAPLSRRTSNMTPTVSTFPEKRVAGSNEVKFTSYLTQKEMTGVADVIPFPDKAQQENVNSLVPNEITDVEEVLPQQEKVNSLLPNEMTNAGDALPCTDRTFVSLSTRQKTMASSIMQNGASPPTEQIDSKTVNARKKDLLKTTMHKLSQRLWPWDASRKTTKSSKKMDAGNIYISAPISHKTKNMTSRPSTSSEKKVAGGNEMIPTPNLKIFSFSELKEATRNFRSDTLLGEGGFGRVYKGRLKEKHNFKLGTEAVVAIKMLSSGSMQGLREWLAEVNFLGRLSHPNLVKLLGYCNHENNGLLLVYEFMKKGSLENHLFWRGSSIQPLPWDIRLKILVGAARGLTFLHTLERTVIYRDFKTSNVLLDESYNAKLADFGLAKSGPTDCSHVTTQVMGTYGYAAPEYVATGHLTVKSDVYGFGVVLVEMLTGLRAIDPNRPPGQCNLVDWIKPQLSKMNKLKMFMDPHLETRYPAPSALQISRLALNCLNADPKNRPSMAQVLERLEKVYAAPHKPRVQFRDLP